MGRLETPLDDELDRLSDELLKLKTETNNLVRNYHPDEVAAMQSGLPRKGAAANEQMARTKFVRMREIEAILNMHHGN
ncbi:MAG: hypothetical protein A2942_02975 [Candidatus Lloydbacteria bacterium RIFCSPLOWO2_01_FULL_50_20]|uniref:Uncharacterized protein n=1 Tax=Candidatus Lloydbacteria bacterium RIFCSPLOWO2_01_FULL_50_20 TaxID=1798665 RepID=A0A1G2DHD1_9BACT|nr:MAG: hypothetical protein A2942_02975 [Candidatus Lloydbacteria bacterium RIFCSPLOWO2_01_FULL_50_20]